MYLKYFATYLWTGRGVCKMYTVINRALINRGKD